MTNQKQALVLIAEGSEEMEFTIIVDVLRRAGINVTAAGLSGNFCVTCSRGVKICPDVAVQEVLDENYDIIIIPGGLGGAKRMSESDEVKQILQCQEVKKEMIAAICAGPTVLKAHGIYTGKKVTAHKSVKEELIDIYKYEEKRVQVDDKLITSIGPGSTFEFALEIVKQLVGNAKKDALIKELSLIL